MFFRKLTTVFLISILFISGCETKLKKNKNDQDSIQNISIVPDTTVVAPEVMDGIIQSIPSPIEISSLIKKTGAAYQEDLLHSTSDFSNYSTNFKQALNLGVYTTDLGYTGIYNKQTASTLYVRAIRSLAEELKVGQFFDINSFQRAKEYARGLQESDSLLFLAVSGFNNITQYLNEKNRRSISTLLLTGSWIEAMYIASQIAHQYKTPELMERLGEQKIVLDNLRLILSVFRKFPEFLSIVKELDELKIIYDKVEITYTYGEPTFKEQKGMLVVEDNSTSQVEIDENIVHDIQLKVELIRNILIK